ncbi:DUF1217 domain-containing protein [Limibaculum sp. M0105]|uniref:DUF1217 domain-containing protein n=1 Tax=Thermohalobaculum xanthum TaxID=2753746 RepID=A0A8J7M4H1_9RHOB|nr:DUF1217 domain-containing protein [Thermohalobaculum xanthum]MBK0398114.1 DUF1217 domain-containing protein [Thermohalobaculum xanthum]
MPFLAAIPTGGLTGFRFLTRTYEAQLEQFSRSPDVERDVEDFIERAAAVTSAAELVQDTRLLRVALGAFGLEDEIGKRAFIRRILEEGAIDPDAFANRLADPVWREFSAALGFGDLGSALTSETTRRELAERFRERQFERAVGEVDVDLRLALNFQREIGSIAAAGGSDKAAWFRILGSPPLRQVIEGMFSLPSSFGQLDLDKQVETLEARSRSMFGSASPAVFRDAEVVEKAVSRFLLNAQLSASAQGIGPATTALTLLRSGGLGAGARVSLIISGL